MRRTAITQQELPANARKVFERKMEGRTFKQGECLVATFQPSTARPTLLIGRVSLKVHQWAYVIYRGNIPAGLNVCHSCDVGRCINPDHLWLGTQRDNMRDMRAKGRAGSTSRRLNFKKAQEIRSREEPAAVLAKEYGCSESAIWFVRRGMTWTKPPTQPKPYKRTPEQKKRRALLDRQRKRGPSERFAARRERAASIASWKGRAGCKQVARIHGVSTQLVYHIWSGALWPDVPRLCAPDPT